MKVRTTLAFTAAGIVLAGAAALPLTPRLVWNRTQSVPTGLYYLSEGTGVARGDLVAYQPAPSEGSWLEAQGYTGAGWPLLKRVAALEGDEVCRYGGAVFINEAPAARVRKEDTLGRGLPRWSGCQILGPQDVFLLADHPRSVDGRYFGIQDRSRITGVAKAVWLPPPRAPDKRIQSGDEHSGFARRYSDD